MPDSKANYRQVLVKSRFHHTAGLMVLTVLFSLHVGLAQECLTPTNNLSIASSTVIKLCPGTYRIRDAEGDGIIKVVNARDVVIDGDSVLLEGEGFTGYGIYVLNSVNVTIENFSAVKNFFYALRIENSDSVTITNCNFSDNKKDTMGFISVWAGVEYAHGGGVLMHAAQSCSLYNNVMKNSNDGIAMYNSSDNYIADNDLSANTGYAIRMFFSDANTVLRNNCSHIYRENPVNSDAGAVLMIVSNNNRIEHNDLRYSSDGIFLGQYGYSNIPNRNYFAYNDASYSPHNAFEATFADGNVFKHNTANYSGYGFWLGYSFNTVVDSNEIVGNHEALSVGTAGIAIERGYNNVISNNRIERNVYGILLWEGGIAPGYEGQNSYDYTIIDNIFTGNSNAIHSEYTERLNVLGNEISSNGLGIYISGWADYDIVQQNVFTSNVSYHIQNVSPDDIDARFNTYHPDDTSLIACKIFDRADDPVAGTVFWQPYTGATSPQFEPFPPAELTEPDASEWATLSSDGRETVVSWDSERKQVGTAALRVSTESGFDVNIHYRPAGGKVAKWRLDGTTKLGFWVYAINSSPNRFQENSVRVGNECGGYYTFSAPSSLLSAAVGQWQYYEFPLAGNDTWQRTAAGIVSLDEISYIEVHADTWDAGYQLWIDGLAFSGVPTQVVSESGVPREFTLYQNYPNPFNSSTTIEYELPTEGGVRLVVYDVLGREVRSLIDHPQPAGRHELSIDTEGMTSGVYFYRLKAAKFVGTKKMLVLK